MHDAALAIRLQAPLPVVVANVNGPTPSFWSSLPPTSVSRNTCVVFQAHSQMRSPAALASALRYLLPTANN